MQQEIYTSNLSTLTIKLNKLNNKAKKFGLPVITYTVADAAPVVRHIVDCGMSPCLDNSHLGYFSRSIVEWTGEAPVINGWKLAARLEHAGDENLVHTVPGTDYNLSAFYNRQVCDHCGVRNNRKETFVIVNENGFKQIGRNCLADYVRSADISGLVAAADYIQEFADEINEIGNGGWGAVHYSTKEIITLAVAAVRQFGFLSFKNASATDVTTATRIRNNFGFKAIKIETIADDVMQAELMMAWLSAQPNSSDYMRNLKIMVSQEITEASNFGYLASLPKAYETAIAPAPFADSEHVGAIKDKLNLTVKIVSINAYETDFGVGHRVKMVAGTNVFTWFASNLPWEVEAGTEVELKGTVKDHTEYKNEKQTILTRCKILTVDKLALTKS